MTLQEVCDKYITERRTKKGGELAALTKRDIARHVDVSFSDWKNKPIVSISRDMCSVRFTDMTKVGPSQANQAFRNLRSLLNFAREVYRPDGLPILLENPVSVVSGKKMWNPNNARNGRIPLEQVGAVCNLLQRKRTSDDVLPSGKTGADIALFLMPTGCRWSEAAELTWERVNLDAGTWHIPDPKNHNEVTFPISGPLLAILSGEAETIAAWIVAQRKIASGANVLPFNKAA